MMLNRSFIFALILFTIMDFCVSRSVKESSFVLTKSKRSYAGNQEIFDRQRRSASAPSVTRFHVISKVTSRYSKTQIVSDVTNGATSAKEVSIELRLPKNAFISNFSMDIDSNTYVGVVKEKAAAKAQYQNAVAKGESAALVSAKVREVQNFAVSVNVAAGNTVTFRLDYDELLIRKLGVYKQVIYADPGQVVENFLIEVSVCEAIGISSIKVSAPTGKSLDRKDFDNMLDQQENVEIRRSQTQALVKYQPTTQQQETFRRNKDVTFSVTYDVVREEIGGEILIKNGYFVHFFAPPNLPVIPKKVVFIIDKSGSMSGDKMHQTKEALRSVLRDLKEHDSFNIITFSRDVSVWRPNEMLDANPHNKQSAIDYVNNINAYGSTNLFQATVDGIHLLQLVSNNLTNSLEKASMLILLTDGQPTTGITDTTQIRKLVKKKINGAFSLFCLGFGDNLDHDFLNKLAYENKGVSRRIYTDSDASRQLKGFYDEVASPLLLHIVLKYQGQATRRLTKTRFNDHFDGSEILVVGRLMPNRNNVSPEPLRAVAEASSATGDVTLVSMSKEVEECSANDNFDMRKVWAYLTIKDLLANKSHISNTRHHKRIDRKILRISLKHNFVTPLTSMVVTKPNADNVIAATKSPFPIPRPQPVYSSQRQFAPTFNSAGSSFLSSHSLSPNMNLMRRRRPNTAMIQGGSFGRNLQPNFGRDLFLSKIKGYTTTTRRPTTRSTSPSTTTPATTSPSTTRMTTTPFVNPVPSNPLELVSSCGDQVTLLQSTNISSPGFPGFYQPNQQCVWEVSIDNTEANNDVNSTLELVFSKLDLEKGRCNRDRILIYPDFDPSTVPTTPEKLCGFENIGRTFTARQKFVVVFQSDNVVNGRGFLASLNLRTLN